MGKFEPSIKILKPISNWLAFCVIIYALPIMAAPLILFYNIQSFGIITTIFESFWSSYRFIYNYCMPVCLAAAPVFIWLYSFRAELDEARHLHEITKNQKPHTSKFKKIFHKYYLSRNKELSTAYNNYLSSVEYKDEFDFQNYLQITSPDIFYSYTSPIPFIPEWFFVQNVSAHTRRGHTRYTKSGPVEIKQHGVRAHTRIRR